MELENHSAAIAIEAENGKLYLRVSGEIDHHSAKTIREDMDRAILLYRPLTVTADLSAVTFMDSAGLGLLMGRFNTASDVGAVFSVCSPTEQITKILQMSGLDRVIPIVKKEKR